MCCKCVLILSLALLCVACGQSEPEHKLSDYLQRLSRVLEIEVPAAARKTLIKMPASHELRVELVAPKIDLLEFLRMADCRLQRLVAAHNSSLGKLARPSQRLIYELEFLQHGAPCAALLRAAGRDDLAQKLAEVLRQKQTQLPAVIWKATLGASETRAFWQVPTALGDYPAETATLVPMAMARLLRRAERWLSGDWQVDSAALERDLQLLKSGDGGALLRSWQLLAEQLGRGTLLLKNRLAERPLCYNEQPNCRARILLNVVQQKFIAGLQPWTVALNRRRYELLPAITQLEQMLASVEPEGYRRWREQRDLVFSVAFGALRRHVAALQPLLEQCGLAPGSAK